MVIKVKLYKVVLLSPKPMMIAVEGDKGRQRLEALPCVQQGVPPPRFVFN